MSDYGLRSRWARMIVAAAVIFAAGCGSDDGGGNSNSQSFALRFAAVDGNKEVGCGDVIEGVGSNGNGSLEISDLRFYVSNLRFSTTGGGVMTPTLDENAFQYTDGKGSVALVDTTSTATGACSGQGITYPEGTARVNKVITGQVDAKPITGVSFDIAIPQALMKEIIANHTAEDAPSPFAEMSWSWAYAYRYFVMNAVVHKGAQPGEAYMHVGSTDCGGDGTKALTDRDSCGHINGARVSLSSFEPATDTIAVDVRALVSGLDFDVSNEETTYVGIECHSSPSQPDCPILFGNLGIDMDTGTSNPATNSVFRVK